MIASVFEGIKNKRLERKRLLHLKIDLILQLRRAFTGH